MECMNKCGAELTGRQARFCSDKCRKAQSRTNKSSQGGPGSTKPDKSDTIHPSESGQTEVGHNPDKVIVIDGDYMTIGRPANFGQLDCQCQHCKTNRINGTKHVINHGIWKPVNQLAKDELNRVALPGDIDYTGITLTAP